MPRFRGTVHPHRCGDNVAVAVKEGVGRGSPPQVWGQPMLPTLTAIPRRFTPTGVGTTYRSYSPHGSFNGSPPQVWGQLCLGRQRLSCTRFTPTGVGTTLTRLSGWARLTVHPHRCGDNLVMEFITNNPNGSPPQVWGQRGFISSFVCWLRFTPTGVGTTFYLGRWLLLYLGSPPQVWGQRQEKSKRRSA